MKNIAIIPARSGSKRIVRKNIRPFLGKPIMAYSIEAALGSGLFDEVMVSTDDREFAEVALQYGASVPFLRSEKTSGDYAGIVDVIDEVIENYRADGKEFDNWCCILSTAPFITPGMLADTYAKFTSGSFDTLRPVVRFSYPIQRAFRMGEDGSVSFLNPENAAARSQDMEPTYHDAGLFYWGTVETGFKGKRWGALEIDEKACQDIDTEEDWALAEMKFKLMTSE